MLLISSFLLLATLLSVDPDVNFEYNVKDNGKIEVKITNQKNVEILNCTHTTRL